MHHEGQKDPGDEQAALAAVERHHARMLAELRQLVASLIQAVENHSGEERSARDALAAWCNHELVPHALAEEGPLYTGPGKTEQGRLLVAGMLAEHQAIVGLVDRLRNSEGVQAAVAGGAIEELFAVHLDKENRLLMPLVAESPELSLADAVRGLHQLVGEAHQHEDPP
jgi:hypothetical protein